MRILLYVTPRGDVQGVHPLYRKLVVPDSSVAPPYCLGHEAEWEVVGASAAAVFQGKGTVFVKPGSNNPCPACAAATNWLAMEWDSEGVCFCGDKGVSIYETCKHLLNSLAKKINAAPRMEFRGTYNACVPADREDVAAVAAIQQMLANQSGPEKLLMYGLMGIVPVGEMHPTKVRSARARKAPIFD